MLIPAILALTLGSQTPQPSPVRPDQEQRLARILARVRTMPPESRLRMLAPLEDLMAHAGPALKPQLEPVIAEIRTIAQVPAQVPAPPTTPTKGQHLSSPLTSQASQTSLTAAEQAILRQRIERVRALSSEGQKRVLAFLDAEIPKTRPPFRAILEALRSEISPASAP